jgi:hypothetical protein
MSKIRGLVVTILGGVLLASANGCTEAPVNHGDDGGFPAGDDGGITPAVLIDAALPERPAPDAARLDVAAADGPRLDAADGGIRDGGLAEVGDGGDAAGDEQAQRLCSEYWTVACQRYAECAPFILQRDYGGDVASCTMMGAASCRSKDNPAAGVSPAMLAACSDERRKSTCSDFLSGGLPSCRLAGPRPNGARCAHNRECQSSRCTGATADACGTCGGIASAGGSCQTARDCAPGLVCDTSNRCATAIAPGKTCAGDRDCDSNAFCNAARTCAALVIKAGDRCEPGGCDLFRALSCHPTSLVCVPVELAKPGQDCGPTDTKEVVCAIGNCPAASGTAKRVCPKVLLEGQACDATGVCAEGMECMAGMCRKVGEPMCL